MRSLLVGMMVLFGTLGDRAVAVAQQPGDTATGPREARIGYQRDRLAVQSQGHRGDYLIVDGYGRALDVRQVAQALGDARTYEASLEVAQAQQVVGATATIGGPALMLVGLSRISAADRRSAGFMRIAGYGTLVAGMAGTAAGIGLLADRRPRMPSTWYAEDEARRLVAAYNERLRASYGLSEEEAAWLPRIPRRVRPDVQVGLAYLGVRAEF